MIDEIEGEFRETFNSLSPSGRLVLTAPTGSGKSTRVPPWCQEMSGGRVLVIEPRRVAARTLAGWVAKSRSEEVGRSVGYSIRFDSKHCSQTNILFVTPGVARRFLVEGSLANFDTVVFDEFHERSWETDSLLALLAADKQGPRLVIMSATLMAESLAETYSAGLLQAQGRAFPVEISYRGTDDQELTVPSGKRLASRVSKACRKAWEDYDDGSVLVFLPGLSSMTEVMNSLHGLPVVLLHGTFSQKEQAKAFDESHRKIVLATNVAESSLTIPDITTVIDSGLERRQIHQSGYVALATVPVAQSSADQRAGRAGRTRPGRCLRLWDEMGRLESMRPPDLCRMELDELVLFFSALPDGLKTRCEWVDEPPPFAWERATERLLKLGLVEEGKLTPLGHSVQRLPVDGEWGRILAMANRDLQGDLADLCALATARRNPLRSTRSEEVGKARKEDWGEDPWGQALALMRVGDPSRHGLESESLRQCRRVSDELRNLLRAPKRPRDWSKTHSDLQEFLARNWAERFFLLRGKRQAWGNGQVECRLARGEELPEDCVAAFMMSVEPILSRGLKVELQGRGGLPVRVSILRKAGLGEPELSKIRWVRGKLQARVVTVHAGRELGSAEEVLEGKALRRALATLAARGSWHREILETMIEEQFYQNLHEELEGRDFEVLEPARLMETRLEGLGVETAEELELLEKEDFLEQALPSYLMDKLRADYPKLYRFGGRSFHMEYYPKRKLVVMNAVSKEKGAKFSVRHLPRWNGWRVELNESGRRSNLR